MPARTPKRTASTYYGSHGARTARRVNVRLAVAGGCAAGLASGWNVGNIGAVATQLATSYGVGLATVGLFTTALFVTHLLFQVPGRAGERPLRRAPRRARRARDHRLLQRARADRARTRRSRSSARTLVGVGTGLAFVSGSAYVRVQGGSPFAQGLFGGVALGGGGLALAIVPPVEDAIGWRAPVGDRDRRRRRRARDSRRRRRRTCRARGRPGRRPRPAGVMRERRLLPAGRALRGVARAQHRGRQLGRDAAPPPRRPLEEHGRARRRADAGARRRDAPARRLDPPRAPAVGARRRRREPRRRRSRHRRARRLEADRARRRSARR